MKIHIVAEGDLEKPVARKLITFCGHQPGNSYLLRGSGNVEKKAASYACLIEQNVAVLVLTDFMDTKCPCFTAAIKKYLKNSPASKQFLLRFAVPELESWLMADRCNFAKLLGIAAAKMPQQPEALADPKKHMAMLVRNSQQRAIKNDLITASGRQGKLYLPKMQYFIEKTWSIEAAIHHAPSLARCVQRLREL